MTLIHKVLLHFATCVCILHWYGCTSEPYITLYSEDANISPPREATNIFSDLEGAFTNNVNRFRRDVGEKSDGSNQEKGASDTKNGDASHRPLISQFKLNNSHHQVMVEWAGEGSNVVVCVTKNLEQNINSTTNVYISYDYGKSFMDKTDLFKMVDKYGIIYKFFKNDKFTNRFVFTDIVNKLLFVTNDFGHTIYPRKLEFVPSEVSMHPTNALVFLIMDRKDKMKKLWVTSDFGVTWRTVSRYVKSYYWSEKTSTPTLYVEREEPGQENTVFAFTGFSDDSQLNHSIVIREVKDFKVKDDFLFAVKKHPRLYGAPSHIDTLELWISYKAGPFLLAHFPNNITNKHYYVADISEGQIMVCVFHGMSSNLYVSSIPVSAGEQIRFSLSLERIFYFSPGTNWNDTWLSKKADEAFADLHRVKGVRGVFIASQLSANFSRKARSLGPEHLTSLITFDQGGEWSPLTPPRIDGHGKRTHCLLKSNCSLQISQELSKLYPGTQYKPILTSASAPGLILSSGVLGASLKGHLGVFLSTDAGVNWYQVLQGNYLYAFGDHGGIMVAVQHYRSNGETNQLLYSIDEGETWKNETFFPEKMRVYGLMTEPGENTTIFTLFGSKIEKHEWIIIQVDMMPVFKRQQCTKTDYKPWTPADGTGRKCHLGRRDTYERRMPHAECYNGMSYDRPVSTEPCPCTRNDYECDFGFVARDDFTCVAEGDDLSSPLGVPLSCREMKLYNRTKGYRKVPGDSCVGGEETKYDPELTACPIKTDQEFILVSNRRQILRYDLMNPDSGLQPLPLHGLDSVIAIDFDLKSNCLYWSDAKQKRIMRECFDGRHHQEVILNNNLESVEGLALDWASRALYFVDGTRKKVEVTLIEPRNLTGRVRHTLLKEPQVVLPRGIALHPVKGYMFITDWSENTPMVARANLDGTNLQILFGKGAVGWPNGVAIDFQTERIVWADAKLDYIASADLDGSNMKKIITNSENVRQPFSVGVYKSLVFWDDWNTLQVFQADKEGGGGVQPLGKKPMEGLVDLKVYGKWSQSGTNACGEPQSNKCQFFCMGTTKSDFTCVCPSWLKTLKNGTHNKCVCSDDSEPTDLGVCQSVGKTCPADMYKCDNGRCVSKTMLCDMDNDCGDSSDEKHCGFSSCAAGSWQCDNGHCISPAWKCDADDDCGDKSDEEGCTYQKCNHDQFTCNNKRCIDKQWVCDLQDDCRDGSDESNCTMPHPDKASCKGTQFQCESSGLCLPVSWRCDTEQDCSDGSDEKGCDDHKCSVFQFQCSSKRCIYKSWVCDGENDCSDGLDEANCPNVTSPMPAIPTKPEFSPSANETCSSLEFRCVDGNCIPFWWRCDDAKDCLDGSDEVWCKMDWPPSRNTSTVRPDVPDTHVHHNFTCREDQMECRSGDCIWEAWVCDGDRDCSDGEDESNCQKEPTCSPGEFRCWHSEGCINTKQTCDGVADCADGSDEIGCAPSSNSSIPDTLNPKCAPGFFSCDGGNCLPDWKRCDHNMDCFDLTDENNCRESDQVFQVSNLQEMTLFSTNVTFSWELHNTNGSQFEFLPACIVKAALGNPKAWRNGTFTKEKFYTFDRLEPFTAYLLKVYVKELKSDKVFTPAEVLTVTTAAGVPTPPIGVTVSQTGVSLSIRWKAPHYPNGVIDSYTVFVSPPNPPTSYVVQKTELLIFPSQMQQSFTIWVTVTNTMSLTSPPSERVTFAPSSVDSPVVGLQVSSEDSNGVTLKWEPIPEVEKYLVAYERTENKFMGPQFVENVTETHITLTSLAPGHKYLVKVRGVSGNAIGPSSAVDVLRKGDPIPSLLGLDHKVQDPATSVKVFWNVPQYNEKHTWQYEVIWGKDYRELENRLNVVSTTNTSMVVTHLDACQLYLFAAMIAGPIGAGPAENFQVATGLDPLAPPKFVKARRMDDFMVITWMPPCSHRSDASLRYLITISETTTNTKSYFDIPNNMKELKQTHKVQMHPGGKYEVTVRNYAYKNAPLNDSRASHPVSINGPEIPAPYELTYNPSDGSFFWRDNKKASPEMLTQSHSYVLYLTRADNADNASSTEDIEVIVPAPPFEAMQLLDAGRIYYARVAYRDQEGYLSPKSQSIRVEKPIGDGIVVTESSMVGVAVSVTLVIIVLVALVGILAVRHKRLARSFSSFANSHYDRSQGTTHITTDHNLDEDDSPMIRGFSDDEPLVIA